LVEHNLAKVRVARSSLVFRSTRDQQIAGLFFFANSVAANANSKKQKKEPTEGPVPFQNLIYRLDRCLELLKET
jgi:hypothetical protein